MTGIEDPRAAYWNETYRKYWQERVAEAGAGAESQVQKGDARTEGDWVYERVFAAHPFRPGRVLDVGCAWGRMFPIYRDHGLAVSGVDISQAMIEAAREGHAGREGIETLEVATAETLPFADASFDNLVCIAVFDATYQHLAAAEFLRVLRPGGRLYLTGKNDRYAADDALALAAEKGARGKGHPNYFTDVPAMRAALAGAGCREVATYGFARRGDFAAFHHSTTLDAPFYEWFLVLEGPEVLHKPDFAPFSSDHSRTFRDLEARS
ncbi:class I SAM-dependent methyltransferase [Fuscovulum ytuae]|uniref:Class I SAM-dependent methyltransferase n=1 Tax=Fuscovulum ytuae TaxID=3042299 RepID=A0ABY8Q494_9RHOB|nr:class I SAM-dependent methyltransferase [Fuscovulum sp. YMD61]WGV15416.1 class I SAM-dependent methyltransferase [Fuscovulum sp. YMD61]